MSDVLADSRGWKERADVLLREKGLVEALSRFGVVHFTGAYAYDLMMHGDVDISVVREREFSIEEVFNIFKELYFEGKFRSYFIGGDWDDPRKGNEFPKGYYFGLKEKVNGERWKFDIWCMSEAEFARRSDNPALATATPEQRALILQCKQRRNEHKISITGQEIYDAVLNGTWKSLEDFGKVQ